MAATLMNMLQISHQAAAQYKAFVIEQGEALADIRKSLLLNSTGLSRELLKLAREANYKESRQCFP
ncbi:cytoplasmic protein, partial [Escherichia coli]